MMSTLTDETIVELAQEVWSTLLGDDGHLRPGGKGGGRMFASISLVGEWNGTVGLTCSESAARHAAAVMFGIAEEELTGDEIADAIGELINVVAGNIKGTLPAPTELSVPAVYPDGPIEVAAHLRVGLEVNFTWLDQPVVVTVWMAAPDPALA